MGCTLFKNADILLTNENGFSVIRNGYLGVKGTKIDYVGTDVPLEAYDEVLDYSHKLLMPGLFNTHCHIPMTLLRGTGSDLPLDTWLHDYIFPVEDRMTDADAKAGTEVGLLEMISGGTVSFSDMYNFNQVKLEAVIQSGIKISDALPVLVFDPDLEYESIRRSHECAEHFREWDGAADGRIKVDYCIHAEYTCTEKVVRRHSEECLKAGARMHLHLCETKKEYDACVAKYGKSPVQWFADLGTFDSPTNAAHCVWLTDEDIQLMAEKNVFVMHNPSSNMKLASGFAPVEKMRKAGILVGLGTDGTSSNNNLNMFEEMHVASIIHNGNLLDPAVMKAGDVLRMATRNGALIQGREDSGMIKEGYRADIIAVDLDRPHMVPNLDTPALICYSAQGSDVCMTMVDGKMLYKDGEFLTLDKDRIMHDAKVSVSRLFG